ncbi:unnamed protein product, partial [Choristocarpus tenellus]
MPCEGDNLLPLPDVGLSRRRPRQPSLSTFPRKAALTAGMVVVMSAVGTLVFRSSHRGVEIPDSPVNTPVDMSEVGDEDLLRSRGREYVTDFPYQELDTSRLYGKAVDNLENRKPNVIFILVDDMGWNDMGYQSTDLAKLTPNLDAMAARGVKLGNYYSNNLCTPSRASLMTGRHTFRYGMPQNVIESTAPWGLSLDEKTLADRFLEGGYDTHMVGKWHLGFYKESHHPVRRGFNSFLGYLAGGETYTSHGWCV